MHKWTSYIVPGVAQALKAVVLDENKVIDVIDVTTLKIGGVTVAETAAELGVLSGVVAGTVSASKAVVVGASKNIDTISIAASGLKIGAGAGTAVTATAAELNTVAGVTAGTVAASKAVVVDANKHVDVLNISASGLGIGVSGSETVVTATGAQLNTLAGVVAGTVSASKAVVVDANKHIDILGLPVSGLKIGVSGSETVVASTGAELNTLNGVTAGTVTASKALVVDANSALNNVIVASGGKFVLDNNATKTVTGSSGAATLNTLSGIITTESLTTAAVTDFTEVLTNSTIAATDMVFAQIIGGTNSTVPVYVHKVTATSSTATIIIRNAHLTSALNGTLKIAFMVLKNA